MIIHFIGPVPPSRGGIAQHSHRLLDALEEGGHDVVVHAWSRQYPARLYPGEERDHEATPRPGARFELRWWDPSSWVTAGRAARGADALLVPWVTTVHAPAYRSAFAAAGPRVRRLAIVHNALPHERRSLDHTLAKTVLRRLDGAVTHAAAVSTTVREIVPTLRLAEVPHPPNLELAAVPLPVGPPWRLLVPGFIRPYKGVDVALDALSILLERNAPVTLTLAGEVWGSAAPWQDAIRDRRLDDVVDFQPAYVPDERLARLFAEHHLVVAPYRNATQSGIVPLAQAAGRPVVASDVGGLSEAVRHGVDGILVPAGDPEALAEGILRALDIRAEMAAAAAAAAPSWAAVADAVVGLIDGFPPPASLAEERP